MIQLVRIMDALPDGFEQLCDEAKAEGHRHMARLADDWACGAQRFDRDGEALLAAYLEGDLVGVGGLTLEPTPTAEPALRMRRLYVSPGSRRAGVARAIASALAQEALGQVALITVHAGDDGAARFWEAQDFKPVEGRPWSHELRR